jgi:hypothetical protein
MAMGASTYLANNVVDHVLKTAAFPQPTNVYASLHSADPGTTGASELSGGAYARTLHNTWNAAAAGSATNSGAITFPQATANWTQATHFGLWDAATAGNFLGGGVLDTAKTVLNGDTAEFAGAALTVTMS